MHHPSCTWRSERRRARLIAIAALTCSLSSPAAAATHWCLPGLFEGGARLQPLVAPQVFWLPPLLRQHTLCRHARDRPREQRVVVIGSSGSYGFPLPADQSAPAELDRLLIARGLPARAFNLGFVNTYQLRDALIAGAALPYDPAVIVYPLTVAEFTHVAPAINDALVEFFVDNSGTLEALASDPLPGLGEPIDLYNFWLDQIPWRSLATSHLRQLGALTRAMVRASGEDAIRLLTGRFDAPPRPRLQVPAGYDCAARLAKEKGEVAWASWNVLDYLDELRRTRGIDVVVAHWPVNHEPDGACYNARISTARLTEFLDWIRAETAARGFEYVDLHDLLPPDEFLDTLHLTAEGNRRVGAALAPVVEKVLRRRVSD